jgi:hypothetical protein
VLGLQLITEPQEAETRQPSWDFGIYIYAIASSWDRGMA